MDFRLPSDVARPAGPGDTAGPAGDGWRAALATVERQLEMPALRGLIADSVALLESAETTGRMLALRVPGGPVVASFVPWPAASCAGEALRAEEIEAAPSLPAKKLGVFRAWRVENLTLQESDPAKAPGTVHSDRVRLAQSLGGPDARGWVAIAAKAVAEGVLSPGELDQVMRWSTAEALGLNRRDLVVLGLMAEGLSLAEIGRRTGMGHGAAWTHARTIGRAMGVEGTLSEAEPRRAALLEARRRGLVDSAPVDVRPPPPGAVLAGSRGATLRAWLVEGEAGAAEAARRGIGEDSVFGQRSLLAGHLGVEQDSDWTGVLSGLEAAGELGPDDTARAAARVIRTMRAGPEAAWRPLLARLVRQDALTPSEATALRCRLRLDEAGVTARPAELLEALNAGQGRPALDAAFPGKSLVKHANALRAALGVAAPWDAGRGAAAIVAAARAAHVVPVPAGAVRDADVATLRAWLVDGLLAPDAGARRFVSEAVIYKERADLRTALGVSGHAGWAPILQAVLDDGRLSASEVARAVAGIAERTGTGPAWAWAGLLGSLEERGGVSSADAAALGISLRAGALGLTGAQRQVLGRVARDESYEDIRRALNIADSTLSHTLSGIGRRLGIAANPESGAPIAGDILAAAHRHGVLPAGYSEAAVGAALVRERAAAAGMPLPPSQARLLHDLNAGVPLVQVRAAQGPAFLQAVNLLRTALGVTRLWDSGLGAHAIVEAGRRAGLVETVPWPDPVRETRRFLGLMYERFGIMRGQYDLLLALAALPLTLPEQERLGRAAAAVGTSPATAEAMVVQMARRFEAAATATPFERIAEALRRWCAMVGLHPGATREERDWAARTTVPHLLESQVDLLIALQARPSLPEMIARTGRQGFVIMRSMEVLERRLGAVRDFSEAGRQVDAVLSEARRLGIVGPG